ncbi:MAG: helix-turn-helix domain-containing protein, partial [Acidobacteria bacterium]|nr:helix-turn-helix domain-containing protein [Acidobacteriota bacterium]
MDALKFIPQLFYDLIARVIPGGVALFVWAMALDKKIGKIVADALEGSPGLQQSAFVISAIIFVLAYLVGHLVSPLSEFLKSNTVERIAPQYFRVLKDAVSGQSVDFPPRVQSFLNRELNSPLEADDKVSSGQYFRQALFLWYDRLRRQDAEVGARLTKLRAEYRMYEEIAGIMGIGLLLHMTAVLTLGIKWNWPLIISGVVIALLGLWGYARAYRDFQRSTINHYYLEVAKPDSSKAESEVNDHPSVATLLGKEMRWTPRLIRRLRGQRTLTEIATLIGISPEILSLWESGQLAPDASQMKKLSEIADQEKFLKDWKLEGSGTLVGDLEIASEKLAHDVQ